MGWRGSLRYVNNHTTANHCPESVRVRDAPLIGGKKVIERIRQVWSEESGQDVAEYAVMLAVILVIVIGTVRLIGSNANTVFSQVQSGIGAGG